MKSKTITCLTIFCLFVANFLGCHPATRRTVPNASIIDPSYGLSEASTGTIKARELLSRLAKDNSLLATQLGKLPELHDGVTFPEIDALEKIIEVYKMNPKRFDKAFVEMNKIGIPEVRKYCVPLQALFWLAEQERVEDIEITLEFYSKHPGEPVYCLKDLLRAAWNFSDITKWRSPQDIMDRLNSPELVKTK